MTPDKLKMARDALYDVGVIAAIIMRIGNDLISGSADPLGGTELEWLGRKLDEAAQVAGEAVDSP